MDQGERPIERRFFETREQEDYYIAAARGFSGAAEMRDYYRSHPMPGAVGGKVVETRDDASTFERRFALLKLSEGE